MLILRNLQGLFAVLAAALAAALLLAPPALGAASVQASSLPLQWRSIGPFRGGRVLAVTGVPGEPEHFYFGSVNGGVWETHNAGRTWTPIFDSAPVGSIGSIAVAPSNPQVLYVGTGEADMRSDIAQGEGMYRSTDAGKTWQSAGLQDSQQIGRILVDPTNSDVVLVAALGHPYGPNEMRGVFRSTDGGRTWSPTLHKDADTGAIDLAAEPGPLKVVYAALWQTRRPPWNVYPPSSGPGSGLYKSQDGGQSWTPLAGQGLPVAPGRIGLAVAPSRPQTVYALVDARDGGLYRSEDAGASWTRATDDSRIWKRGWYFSGVTVDPTNPNIVYVCNTATYRSEDGGKTFVPVKGAPGGDDYHVLWIDPGNAQRRILGVDQGALITLDGGATWSSWYNQPTGQFYHVVTDNRFPYWVYGAQQDSGAAAIPSRTDNIDGINLRQFHEVVAGGENDNIAPDPDDPDIVFGGRVDKLDRRTGQTHSITPTLAYPGLYRGTWTLPLVFGKPGTHTLYFGNQRIFRTLDGGKHWQTISPDLSREDPPVPPNLDQPTIGDVDRAGARRGVVYAIGPSPLDDKLIWAGTDDGLVWRTRDAGQHWDNVTPPALSAWSKVGVVEASHFDARTAYIAVDRHRLDDSRPYIYRTHDDGVTWTLVADAIAETSRLNSVNVVREDPVQRGLLYCGTERGVYVSLDDGAHWQGLQQNLPRTSVRDLQVHGDDLVIATHGRGFWIMDDIAPLRSLAGDPSSATRLLPPAMAYRLRSTGFMGTPMPKDEAMGSNPPLGAYIDYALSTESTPVMLTISDARGALVRTFSSNDKPAGADLARIEIAPEWIMPPEPLATTAGFHRFVWDLHYAPKAALVPSDPSERELGVWVPPGQYSLDLQAGGHQYHQTLSVAPDPRVHLAASAYAEQFTLAHRIEGARVQIAAALSEAEHIHTAIATHAQDTDASLTAAMRAADQQLLAISDIAPPKRSPDSLGVAPQSVYGLRNLEAVFQQLAQAVDGADTTPTPDAVRGYSEHRVLLDKALAEWAHFKADTLSSLNRQLSSAGAAPLRP
ncbi:MAG TPA: hypothetical protein VGL55_12195 [Steroidobacteraceae bacterium]